MKRPKSQFTPVAVMIASACLGLMIPLNVFADPGGSYDEQLRILYIQICELNEQDPNISEAEKTYNEELKSYYTELCEEEEGSGDGNPAEPPKAP